MKHDPGTRGRWAHTFAWAIVALTVWTANWWLSLVVPAAPVAIFLTTIIGVSFFYALTLAALRAMFHREVGTWTFLPRGVRENAIAAFAFMLAVPILVSNVHHHKTLGTVFTSIAATTIGLGIATWWRPLLATARKRAVRSAIELVENVRGRPR